MARNESNTADPTYEMERWVDQHCGPHADAYVGYPKVQVDVLATCLSEHWTDAADEKVSNTAALPSQHAGEFAVAVVGAN